MWRWGFLLGRDWQTHIVASFFTGVHFLHMAPLNECGAVSPAGGCAATLQVHCIFHVAGIRPTDVGVSANWNHHGLYKRKSLMTCSNVSTCSSNFGRSFSPQAGVSKLSVYLILLRQQSWQWYLDLLAYRRLEPMIIIGNDEGASALFCWTDQLLNSRFLFYRAVTKRLVRGSLFLKKYP